MTLQAIGFDFDDTIMERELAEVQAQAQEFVKIWGGNSTQIAKKVFAELRGRPPRMSDYFVAAGWPREKITESHYKRFEPIFLKVRVDLYLKLSKSRVTRGFVKFLKAIAEQKEKRKLKLFIVSGTSTELIENALRQLGIDLRVFDSIINSREKPKVVKGFLESHGIDPKNSLFVGDSQLDYQVSKELGTQFLGLKPKRAGAVHEELRTEGARILNNFLNLDEKIKPLDKELSTGIREHILKDRAARPRRFARRWRK
jgi:FMN phosphatase YigB (HAD superfamily)